GWADGEGSPLASSPWLPPERSWNHLDGRLAQRDQLEAAVEAATSTHDRDQLAEQLCSVGLEATAVLDLADLNHDPQLQHRGHFVPMSHPIIEGQNYERLGFRLADSPPSFTRPAPTMGRDNEEVDT